MKLQVQIQIKSKYLELTLNRVKAILVKSNTKKLIKIRGDIHRMEKEAVMNKISYHI